MKVLEDLGIEPGPLALNADMLTITPGTKSFRRGFLELFLKLFYYCVTLNIYILYVLVWENLEFRASFY